MKNFFIILGVLCCTLLPPSFAKGMNGRTDTQEMFRVGNWDVEADLVSANGGCYKLHVRIYQIEADGAKTLVAYGDVWYPVGCGGTNYVVYEGYGFEGGNVNSG